MLGILILDTATAIPMFIFTEAGLSFLGIGLKAPSISLGVLISMGQQNMDFYPSQLLSMSRALYHRYGIQPSGRRPSRCP